MSNEGDICTGDECCMSCSAYYDSGYEDGLIFLNGDLSLVLDVLREYVGNSQYMKELLIQALKDENLI